MTKDRPHYCDDWDGMLVVPNSEEMNHCTCNRPIIRSGDEVRTSYNPKQSKLVRIVEECYIPDHKCQTGYHIRTTDGLAADSAWFNEV